MCCACGTREKLDNRPVAFYNRFFGVRSNLTLSTVAKFILSDLSKLAQEFIPTPIPQMPATRCVCGLRRKVTNGPVLNVLPFATRLPSISPV